MTTNRRIAAFLATCACALAAHAEPSWAPPSGLRVEPREQGLPVTEGLAKAASMRATHAHAVRLATPAPEKAAHLAPASKSTPLQIGFARDVAELQSTAATAAALEWEKLADGTLVAAIRLGSGGAAALRAGLRVASLPDAAKLRFQAPGDATLFEITGKQLNDALLRNRDAGDPGDDATTWWSPVIDGDTLALEIELPAGSDPNAVAISIPLVSHLVTSAGNTFMTPTTIGQSQACEVDVSCSSSMPNERNAVAEMIFSDGTGTFLCTGTLLADEDPTTSIPYFLTANHCISSQTAASSLTTYWFYRSSSCNSGTPGPYRQLTGGATLLYHSLASDARYTDTSFMRLNNTPPQGTFYAGWSASTTPGLGGPVIGLHQPLGDLTKISQGGIGGYLNCTAPSNGGFSCTNASSSPSSSTFYDVGWSSGVTEPGSSGSALFSSGYVVGQLFGGSGDCTTPGDDAYGRLDVAYNVALKSWLSPAFALAVARAGSGTGTVTSAPNGISCGAACSASFAPATAVSLAATPAPGSSFSGWSGACTGTGACTVTMSSAASVTATFTASAVLAVSTTGQGRVSSTPAGIDCGGTCSAAFALGSSVTLTAAPSTGQVFRGWTGACAGTGSCVVAMASAQSVSATFATPSVDVALAQAAISAAAVAGKDVVLTLTATNNGPDSASNVTIGEMAPAGATLVWVSGNCVRSSSSASCSLGTVAAHASASATVVLSPSAAGSLTNSATVTSTEPDSALANNVSSFVVSVSAPPAANIVPRYRLYSPVTQEHLYTTSLNEYDVLAAQVGTWIQEGLVGKVLDNPGVFNGVTATPYYRLYNTSTRFHHWTTDPNEYYTLIQFPFWNAEGVDGYILPAMATGAEQLYRLVYPDGRGLHLWTIDPNEYTTLTTSYGWVGEGGAGFVIQ